MVLAGGVLLLPSLPSPPPPMMMMMITAYWKTRMCLHAENKLIETEDIKIQCGLFQGDSLLPLLFCICLIPLTEQLNRLNTGYEEHATKTKISHLLYYVVGCG